MRRSRFQVILAIAAVTLLALAMGGAAQAAPVTEADLRAFGAAQTEPFRLLFVTSTGRDATSANIADYNAFADAAADNPGSIVSFLDTEWRTLMNAKDGPMWFDNIGLSLTPWDPPSYSKATIDDPIFLLDGTDPELYREYNNNPYLPDPPNVPINITEQGNTLAGTGYVWTGWRNTLGDATGRPGNYGKTLHRCVDDDAWRPNTEIHPVYAMSELLDPADFAAGGSGPVDVPVPNGSFEDLYKPGTAIHGNVSSGGWTQGVGPDCPIDNGQYEFTDSTTGTVADIAGWIGADRDGWIAAGGTYGRDQTTGNLQGSVARQGSPPDGLHCYVSNGGSWGNSAGGLIVSDAPLGTVQANSTYTLSMLANANGAGATPVVLDLLADGVVITPTSLVDPTLSGEWQEFSRVYDPGSLAGLVGQDLTILLGVGRQASGTQTRFDSVSLSYITSAVVPEPSTFALAALGLVGLAWFGWRRRRRP